MNYLTKYLNRSLSRYRTEGDISPEIIATAIANMVLRKPSLHGSKILTQKILSTTLRVPLDMVKAASKILRTEFGLIVARPGHGTSIVARLSKEENDRIVKLLIAMKTTAAKVSLDQTVVQRVNVTFDRKIQKSFSADRPVDEVDKNLEMIPSLTTLFTQIIRVNWHQPVNDVRVQYSDNYREIISYCTVTFAPGLSSVVSLVPVTRTIQKGVRAARKRLRVIYQPSLELTMHALQQLCESESVGLVYIGTAIPYHVFHTDQFSTWKRFRHLQVKYGFKILIDDRYPGQVPIPIKFPYLSSGICSSTIYLSPLSNHSRLNSPNIIAGDAQTMKALSKAFKYKGLRLPPTLSYAVEWLLTHYKIGRKELHYVSPPEIITAAKDLLLASGLFVAQHINNNSGPFIFLQLASGDLPNNLYRKFKANGIIIMHPDEFNLLPLFENGFFISICNYTSIRTVEKDIRKVVAITIKTKRDVGPK